MCNPTAIAVTNFAVQAVAAKADYDDAKQRAKLQAQRNEQARKSAQISYLEDLAKLDREKDKETKLAAIEREKKETELIKDQATAELLGLEKGNANINATLRDIGYEYQPDFIANAQSVEDINTQTLFGYNDAYKAMERSYYSLKAPVIPSKTAMALKIAGAGASTYGKYESGQYGQT
jgi:hypothetical protein